MFKIFKSYLAGLAFGILVSICGLGGANAQYAAYSVAPGQVFGVELDSADGHRSEWFKNDKDLASFSAFRASCTVLRLGSSKNGFGFRVWFAGALKSEQDGYGLELTAESDKGPIAMELRYWDKTKKDVVLKRFAKTLSINEAFLVELVWTDKKLRVAISQTEYAETPIPHPVSQVYISASTGDMRCQQAALGKAPL